MGVKEALQITLFILSWVPIGFLVVTPLLPYDSSFTHDFSIYNTEWNGMSDFREQIESDGYTTQTIQSSMSVITRTNGSGVLFIVGPVRDFSIDTLTIFNHLMAGGSVVIADDFGTANSSLALLNTFFGGFGGLESQLQGAGVTGILSFADGVLLDLDSYDRSPKLPVITDLRPHPLTQGVTNIHLNNATAITPTSVLGALGIAWTTNRAWCDRNVTLENPSPDGNELNGSLPVIGALDMSSVGTSGGKLIAISDPSIFINDMYDRFAGNRQLASNIVDWCTDGNTSIPIVFCEQLLATPILSGEFLFGSFMGRIFWASTSFFLAPAYPLMTAIGIKKYLPDIQNPEVRSVSEVFLRKGRTYFSERMSYYRSEGNYARVVKMLYRRLRRETRRKYQWTEFKTDQVWELMKYKDSKLKEQEFFKVIDRIEEISQKQDMRIKEGEMMSLFFFMRNIQNKLIES